MFAPAVCWNFVGTGLYAWRHRPESRIGALMVALGFAWLLFCLQAADSPAVYAFGIVAGGLWGSRVPAHRAVVPDGPAARGLRPRARDRGLRDLPAGVRARPALRRHARFRRAAQPAADRRRAGPGARADGARRALLCRPVRGRGAARAGPMAGDGPVRAAPGHARLRVLAAHLRPGHDRAGRRGRRRVLAGVRLDRADAVRVPRRPAAQPRLPPRRASCRRASTSCARRARGSWRPATPRGGGSSATCTTARSRGSSRSRCCCAAPA